MWSTLVLLVLSLASVPEPRRVTVEMFLLDIRKIADADQTMSLDVAVRLRWKDPALANGEKGTRSFEVSEVWYPDVGLANVVRIRKQKQDLVQVDGQGNASYTQRYIGEISAQRHLSDFPFDSHRIRIWMVTSRTSDEITFDIEASKAGQMERFSVSNWRIGEGVLLASPLTILGEVHPGFAFEFEAERHGWFFILVIILPLTIVVLMSWSVFWIDPVNMGPQIGVATTSILTLIAHRFALSQLMPRLPYLTRLDIFTLCGSILVFLALVEVIVTSNLASDKKELARRFDRVSRWLFPSIFVASFVVAFLL